jgi:hypothetical protein
MRGFALLLVFAFVAETPSAQTVADIARRERARQKQTEPARKGTYTNGSATVNSTSAAPATANASAPAEKPAENKTATAAAKTTGATDRNGHDEKYWREAFQKAREAVRQADEKVQVQESKLKDLNTQLLRQSDIYNKENVLGPLITGAQQNLEAAKAEAEQARNKVSSLEDELRAAGGLPGWAR